MGGRAWNTVGRGADKNQGRKEGAFLFLLTPEEGVWWSSTGLCGADGCGWQRPAGTHSQGAQGRQSHWQEGGWFQKTRGL